MRKPLLAATLALVAATAFADSRGGAPGVDATVQANKSARAAQARIDQLDDDTRAMLERYRADLWQTQQLQVYVEQVQPLVDAQDRERADLEQQAKALAGSTDVTPLLMRMIDTLDRFVALDLPFLQDERKARIASLRRMMTDPSVPVAERFRRVLEAYRVEADYGRGLGAERVELQVGSAHKVVDVLRVGRVALYALSLDGADAAYWDPVKKAWLNLSDRYRGAIREGLRIAHETAAPLVFTLPVPAPVAATSVAASAGAGP